jgi:hypothetical protein
VLAEYAIEDVGGLMLLQQACSALDRAESLRAEIEADGAIIRTRGTIREHPALRHELANRAFVVKTLQRLGLDVEPLRSGPGRPPSGGVGIQPWKQT